MTTAERQAVVCDGAVVAPVVLVDGVVRGPWGDAGRGRLPGFATGDAGVRVVLVLDPA